MRFPKLFIFLLSTLFLTGCSGSPVGNIDLDPVHQGDDDLQRQARKDITALIEATSQGQVPESLFPRMSDEYAALCRQEAQVTELSQRVSPPSQSYGLAWHISENYHLWSSQTPLPFGGWFQTTTVHVGNGTLPQIFQAFNYRVYAGMWRPDSSKPAGSLSFSDDRENDGTYCVSYSLPVVAQVPTDFLVSGVSTSEIDCSITYRASDHKILQISVSPWFFYQKSISPAVTVNNTLASTLGKVQSDVPLTGSVENYTIVKTAEQTLFAQTYFNQRGWNIAPDPAVSARIPSIKRVAFWVDSWDWSNANENSNNFPNFHNNTFSFDLFRLTPGNGFRMEGITYDIPHPVGVTLTVDPAVVQAWLDRAHDISTTHTCKLNLYLLGTITRTEVQPDGGGVVWYNGEKLVLASVVSTTLADVDLSGGNAQVRETDPEVIAETDLRPLISQLQQSRDFSIQPTPVLQPPRKVSQPIYYWNR